MGQVVVYRSDLFDGVQAGCNTAECAPMALLGPTGSGAGQLFGASLGAGFLQQNDLEDLIIGSPGTGKGYLTKDLPQVGFTDAEGRTATATTWTPGSSRWTPASARCGSTSTTR